MKIEELEDVLQPKEDFGLIENAKTISQFRPVRAETRIEILDQFAKTTFLNSETKLRAMWTSLKTKAVMEYIKLIDSCIIILCISIKVLNIFEVSIIESVSHREQYSVQLKIPCCC